MSNAEVRVLIRYGQIMVSVLLLAIVGYLGMSWCSHMIGSCMTTGECPGPFYHVRHLFGVFVMTSLLVFILVPVFWWLQDRWQKDIEREEAKLHEKAKEKSLENFSEKGPRP
jgi:uncharacterized membrane protein